jgi:DNA-directed RNA polymerase specialized sigma24 family protein
MLRLADHLAPADRALIRSIYDRGLSAGELSRALGRTPRSVRRQVQRLVQRVSSPEYRLILRRRREWSTTRRRVAELVFLRGGTQRAAAEATGLSLHETRREIDRIRLLIDQGLEQARREEQRRQALCTP